MFTKEDLNVAVWLLSLVAASIGVGMWQHSIGLGIAVFFGTLVYLFHRER